MRAVDLLVPGDPASRTGGYVYDRRILEGLEARGWRTRVHALDRSFPVPTREAAAGGAAVLGSIPAGRLVVVDGLALGGLAASLAAERRRLRLVALVHHPVALETGLPAADAARLEAAESAALSAVRGVIVTSAWTARELARGGIEPARIRVVEPGTDAAPARGPRGGPVRRLLAVGTLTPRKGHALLLAALAGLADRPWELECVGSRSRDPSTAAALARLGLELGLDGRVTWRGELEPAELAESYGRADAFVLASYLEGYGMALAEALAHGLPVVSTTAGAIPETVPDGAGLLVPAGDRPGLERALARLLDEPELAARLAAVARQAGAKLPGWPIAAERFARALQELAP